MGLIRGFLAPFRGALFVARHRLWGFIAFPLLLNLMLAWFGYRIFRERVVQWWGMDGWGGWAAALGLALVLMFVCQPILSAPFVDALTERVEKIVTGAIPSVGFFRSVGRSILHGILAFALYALGFSVAFVLGTLTGLGGVFGLVLTGVFLAFDGFNYPLDRRGIGFVGKWGYLLRNPGVTTGYATGTAFLYMVPLAILVAAPFAAAGATLAYLDAEKDTSNVAKRNNQAAG